MRKLSGYARVIFLFFISLVSVMEAKTQIISLDSFESKMRKEPRPQVVDTRSAEEFSINHIDGAINIDPQSAGYKKKIGQLDTSRPVFLYAIGISRSSQLAALLQQKGFRQTYILKGGIGGWIGNGKEIFTTSRDTFSQTDLDNLLLLNKTVLVDLHTKFCPTCRNLQPVIDSLTTEFGSGIKVVKIDIYYNPRVAANFKVDAVPALIAYDNGKIIYQQTGADISKKELEAVLTNAVISR